MKNSTSQIEVPLSKKKLVLMLIGSIVFITVGFWFVIDPPPISNPYFGNPTRLFIIGIAAIIMFGFCAIYIVRKLTDKKPGLIIDNVGLTDHSSGVSAGQILWSDIVNISVMEIHRQKIIMLEVKNPQDYIDKQTNGFKRKLMQMNFNMYGTPLSITSNSLQISFDELLSLINNRIKTNP